MITLKDVKLVTGEKKPSFDGSWHRHTTIHLGEKIIGFIQTQFKLGTCTTTTHYLGEQNCAILGQDADWVISQYNEENGGRAGRLARIVPRAMYRVPQLFGLAIATQRGRAIFPAHTRLQITRITDETISFSIETGKSKTADALPRDRFTYLVDSQLISESETA